MIQKELHIRIPFRGIVYSLSIFIFAAVLFIGAQYVFATAPNPGHNFSEVGGGAVQGDILYGSAADTIAALPKSTTATRYLANTGTSNNPQWDQVNLTNGVTGILPIGNGGTGWANVTSGAVLYGNGAGALATTTAGTAGFVLALLNGVPTWTATTTLSTITGTLSLTKGGTNGSLIASNGGIVYSDASQFQILGGTATAGQILRSGTSAAPSWSTATYPATAGTAGQVLMSNGTNWNTSTTSSSVSTLPLTPTTGVLLSTALAGSLTTRKVGRFHVSQALTVNQITISIGAWTAAGVLKVCVYDKYGATKLIDISTASIGATGAVSTAVSAVVLGPDDYYIAIGCASGTCTMSPQFYTTPSTNGQNASVPAGKPVYEGTVSHTSGTCNAALGTITAAVSNTPVARLDN